jgi:uncharacterized membrane protein YecN with MAPEG domain
MITALYAGLLALWVCKLIHGVAKLRRAHQILLGDGGNPELLAARSAHSNAVETIPIFLILLYLFEISLSPLGTLGLCLLHFFGVLFIVGRVLHAQAILSDTIKKRLYGMQITVVSIATLASANIALYVTQLINM